jgi:hypothetical protein
MNKMKPIDLGTNLLFFIHVFFSSFGFELNFLQRWDFLDSQANFNRS